MGLRARIYTTALFERANCSNGGISAVFDEVTLVNVEGGSEPTDSAPAVLLVQGAYPGIVCAVPAMQPDFRTTHEPVASHDLADDPPANSVGWVYRRTCRRCDRAALQVPGGPLYGSATTEWCGEGTGEWTPLARPGEVGPAMGGAYIASSDERFVKAVETITGGRFYGAVALHDRFESAVLAEAMSR